MGLDTNTRIAAGLDAEQPSLLQQGKAKQRERQLVAQAEENRALYSRLVQTKPVMQRRQWADDYEQHLAHMRHACKLPCVLAPIEDGGGGDNSLQFTLEDRGAASADDDADSGGGRRRRPPRFGRRSESPSVAAAVAQPPRGKIADTDGTGGWAGRGLGEEESGLDAGFAHRTSDYGTSRGRASGGDGRRRAAAALAAGEVMG